MGRKFVKISEKPQSQIYWLKQQLKTQSYWLKTFSNLPSFAFNYSYEIRT